MVVVRIDFFIAVFFSDPCAYWARRPPAPIALRVPAMICKTKRLRTGYLEADTLSVSGGQVVTELPMLVSWLS